MEPQLPFERDDESGGVAEARVPAIPRVRHRIVSAHDAAVRRRRWFTRAVVAASAVLMINALVGDRGYLAANFADRQAEELDRQIAALERENQRMIEEIEGLRVDPAALEEAARKALGFIKDGETLVIESPAKPVAAPGVPAR